MQETRDEMQAVLSEKWYWFATKRVCPNMPTILHLLQLRMKFSLHWAWAHYCGYGVTSSRAVSLTSFNTQVHGIRSVISGHQNYWVALMLLRRLNSNKYRAPGRCRESRIFLQYYTHTWTTGRPCLEQIRVFWQCLRVDLERVVLPTRGPDVLLEICVQSTKTVGLREGGMYQCVACSQQVHHQPSSWSIVTMTPHFWTFKKKMIMSLFCVYRSLADWPIESEVWSIFSEYAVKLPWILRLYSGLVCWIVAR